MRHSSSLFATVIFVLLLLAFYFGSRLRQPWSYLPENAKSDWRRCYCAESGEDLCYRLPENESVVGERFNCDNAKHLRTLGLTPTSSPFVDLAKQDLPSPVVVTAFSNSHYNKGLKLISSVRAHFPKQKIVVYDLGLHRLRVHFLKGLCNVEYRKFEFTSYPLYVKHLHEYRWKPILIAESLHDFGAIWYMDSSVRLRKSNLEHVYDLLNCRRNGILVNKPASTYSTLTELEEGWNINTWNRNVRECSKMPYLFHSFTGHGIFAATHSDVYNYIPTNLAEARKAKMYEAGLVFVVRTREVTENLLKWSVLCALEKGCMAPVPLASLCQFPETTATVLMLIVIDLISRLSICSRPMSVTTIIIHTLAKLSISSPSIAVQSKMSRN